MVWTPTSFAFNDRVFIPTRTAHRAEAAAREQEARGWESELARTEETPEQRRARIKAHALALKEKKCVLLFWLDRMSDLSVLLTRIHLFIHPSTLFHTPSEAARLAFVQESYDKQWR